jgi:hypothetical protein
MYLGSAGKRWLTGATEWPFECGPDGMSAIWYCRQIESWADIARHFSGRPLPSVTT